MQPYSPDFRYGSSLLVILSCFTLFHTAPSAAQTSVESTQPTTQQAALEPPPQPTRRRLRATFFEEERRVHPYGAMDFLDAALDGADNTLVDNSLALDLQESDIFSSPDGIPGADPNQQPGNLRVTSRNPDNEATFLRNTTFRSDDLRSSFTIFRVNPGSNPQTGTITLRATINGRVINIVNGQYSGSYSRNGDRASGVLRITDPKNPRNTIFVRVLPANISGIENSEQTVTGRATITVGRPLDR